MYLRLITIANRVKFRVLEDHAKELERLFKECEPGSEGQKLIFKNILAAYGDLVSCGHKINAADPTGKLPRRAGNLEFAAFFSAAACLAAGTLAAIYFLAIGVLKP